MIVSYTHEIPMGHRLQHHEGKCRFLHGHNYVVEVQVQGHVNNDTGMVMDFHDLKTAVKEVLDRYDHAFVLELGDNILREVNQERIIYIEAPPTAEMLATVWRQEIAEALQCEEKKISIGVRETQNCRVWLGQ